jgi:ankyrin repeat protein
MVTFSLRKETSFFIVILFIIEACRNNRIEVVLYFINDVNKRTILNMTPLIIGFYFLKIYLASDRGHLEIVKLLIENKAEINSRNDSGYNALFKGN